MTTKRKASFMEQSLSDDDSASSSLHSLDNPEPPTYLSIDGETPVWVQHQYEILQSGLTQPTPKIECFYSHNKKILHVLVDDKILIRVSFVNPNPIP